MSIGFVAKIEERPVDLERLADISGRPTGWIYDSISLINEARMPILPTAVANIKTLEIAVKSYRGCKDGGQRMSILFMWILFCQTEQEFREVFEEIPKTGSLLEFFALKKTARICPGE